MLKNSQTKVIMPAVALGVLRHYSATKQTVLGDAEIKSTYQESLRFLKIHWQTSNFPLSFNLET